MSIPHPDPLEIYSGIIVGRRHSLPPPPPPPSNAPPREVLDELLLEAYAEQPVHVSFSGGRDSSVILAALTQVARRHGLPDPIPLTSRYPDHPKTHENEWQEMVVRHLGLEDWIVFDVTTELDALGELATGALRRHGIFWPSNGYSMAMFARQVGSGTLVTGSGGDEMFTPWARRRVPPRQTLRRRPWTRAVKWTAFYALPGRVRHEVLVRRARTTVPWLTPAGQKAVTARYRKRSEYAPTWADVASRVRSSRYYELVRAVLDTFAADEGVRLLEPLYDPRFVQALVRHSSRNGFHNRGAALEALFGDLLPREVLYRSTKASFNEIAWGPHARAFADSWDGSGVDTEIVDPDRLREEWAKPRPDVRCLGPLHQAWLATT